MTLLFMDGFDDFYEDDDLRKKWDNYIIWGSNYFESTTGRYDGKALYGVNSSLYKSVNSESEIICGFAVNRGSNGYNINNGVIGIYGLVYEQGSLEINTDGTLYWDGSTGTMSVGPSTNALSLNTWYYIEVRFKQHATAGEVEVRVNGSQWIYGTGDTLYDAVGIAYIQLKCGYIANYMSIDDFYLLNTSGSVNNDFLGDVRVISVKPNGAGNYAQFTPSAGNNYECVDDADWSGTDYVESGTDGQIDTHNFESIPSEGIGEIFGVQLCNGGKKTVTSNLTKMKHVVRNNSTNYISDAEGTSDNILVNKKIYELDPNDSQAWTKAKLDATEFGYQSVIS